ncbi:hypothetical protein [Sphingomonas sp. Root710]|nr:hypothetical protein [Sphingomonas sp. Root710]
MAALDRAPLGAVRIDDAAGEIVKLTSESDIYLFSIAPVRG